MNNEQQYGNLEIDLNEFDKETLIHLIIYAHDNNITFNEAIIQVIQQFLNTNINADSN
jgi:hypothetical protein